MPKGCPDAPYRQKGLPCPKGHLEVPEGVCEIAYNAFFDCKTLTSVTFPDTLVRIGAYSFRNTGLTQVTIPDRVEFIGQCAFYGTGITSVTVPSTTEIHPWRAFPDATQIIRAAAIDLNVDDWG